MLTEKYFSDIILKKYENIFLYMIIKQIYRISGFYIPCYIIL